MDDITSAAQGAQSLDAMTKAYIHEHLGYRFVVVDDGRAALALERQVQEGTIGRKPLLNPR